MQNGVQNQPWEGPGATWGVTWGGLGSQVAPGFDFGAILEPKWLKRGALGASKTIENHYKIIVVFPYFFTLVFKSFGTPWGSFWKLF